MDRIGTYILNNMIERVFNSDGTFVDIPLVEEPYTIPVEVEIARLKEELNQADYKAIKYAEGWISEEDYKIIKEDRQRIRNRINELENDNYKE